MANKKSFKSDINPAMQFISQTQETEPVQTNNPPEGYKRNPVYIEIKSRRLQILLQPSLYAKLRDKAISEGKSINELIHSTLEDALTTPHA